MDCVTYTLYDACGGFAGYDTVCWRGNSGYTLMQARQCMIENLAAFSEGDCD